VTGSTSTSPTRASAPFVAASRSRSTSTRSQQSRRSPGVLSRRAPTGGPAAQTSSPSYRSNSSRQSSVRWRNVEKVETSTISTSRTRSSDSTTRRSPEQSRTTSTTPTSRRPCSGRDSPPTAPTPSSRTIPGCISLTRNMRSTPQRSSTDGYFGQIATSTFHMLSAHTTRPRANASNGQPTTSARRLLRAGCRQALHPRCRPSRTCPGLET
jgi:hypothetical protein